jgi:hypothetical protein
VPRNVKLTCPVHQKRRQRTQAEITNLIKLELGIIVSIINIAGITGITVQQGT